VTVNRTLGGGLPPFLLSWLNGIIDTVRSNHVNQKLYDARHAQLKPADASLLWRFTQAYRPHDTPQSWQELKAQGLERVEEENMMDLVRDQFEVSSESDT